MAKIVFQGFNNNDNPFSLSNQYRRILNSQCITVDINNEQAIIAFTINKCNCPVEYQAKTIKIVMDEFVNESRCGMLQRSYKDRQYHITRKFIETINNNRILVF